MIAAIAVGAISSVVSAAGVLSGLSFSNLPNLWTRSLTAGYDHCGERAYEDVYEYCSGYLADKWCEGADCKKKKVYCKKIMNKCKNDYGGNSWQTCLAKYPHDKHKFCYSQCKKVEEDCYREYLDWNRCKYLSYECYCKCDYCLDPIVCPGCDCERVCPSCHCSGGNTHVKCPGCTCVNKNNQENNNVQICECKPCPQTPTPDTTTPDTTTPDTTTPDTTTPDDGDTPTPNTTTPDTPAPDECETCPPCTEQDVEETCPPCTDNGDRTEGGDDGDEGGTGEEEQ